MFVLVLVLVGVAYYVVAFSRLGRHVRAVGGDELAAGRAGIRVRRIRVGALLVSSLGASIAGLIYIGQQGGASNTLGTDITFQVYAALMIGGYSIIRGGVGNPLGGAMGLIVIAGVTEIIVSRRSIPITPTSSSGPPPAGARSSSTGSAAAKFRVKAMPGLRTSPAILDQG